MSTHNLCFEQKYEKYQRFLSENFQIFYKGIFYIIEWACFRNGFHSGKTYICSVRVVTNP